MAVQRLSISAVGNSASFGLPMKQQDWNGNSQISLLVNFSGGGPAVATVNVQVSNDPLAVNTPASARWNNHDTLNTLTGDKNSTLAAPIYAIRLNCTAYTSGTVTLDVGYGDQL